MSIKMVNIHRKPVVYRQAVAAGEIRLRPQTVERIRRGNVEKGDPKQIAIIAGIQGAKMTPRLLPLCHPLGLESVEVDVKLKDSVIEVQAKVVAEAKTGVEMEALTAVSAALLTVWDVVKMYEKTPDGQYPHTQISNIRVLRKVKHEPSSREA
ncbi:MAG: cyclic pyranopterin monophosphate synthase MoaC [Thaumarchaeota archaeon]|nr:cyclic pyranopterin monophosphate synthase MoaC [Nitrososphaerota archaeon]